jgi:nicotinamide mononucleotide transporter
VSSATFLQELAAWSALETVAAILALAYLVLAARESLWCWVCAFGSTVIYLGLFFDRQLYQQSLLQIFYLGMAVYGFLSWRGGKRQQEELAITSWPAKNHVVTAVAVLGLTFVTGWLEDRYTSAPMPYLDAFTTWGSVITTWMVTRKVIENWLYWLLIDGALVYVYYRSNLPATALLFVIYLGIVIAGYFRWRRVLRDRPVAVAL